ncbi:Ferric/cupric reductase transmembrane component B [Fulvia fulva]|nr:Ferric/cupric reductase transmembrane component B [Fulvia fulva]WPV26049.1 Ferric/cupric reductase transmembrane component B [Fulvia fulva]
MHSLLHSHLHHVRGTGQSIAAHVGGQLVSRDPSPDAIAAPHHDHVADTGKLFNMSDPAAEYSHGLTGVNQGMNFLFTHVLIASFCGLLLATLLYRWWHMLHSHFRHILSLGRDADQRYWMYNHSKIWPWLKKHLLFAPLFRNRHNREFHISEAVTVGTLPSRFHSVLIVLYLASNIAYTLAIDWNNPLAPAVAEMRGRTGVLAMLNLIPTVLFALRNNPLIPILGVSYDTFNLLHRWCARVMVIESIIHSVMWGINSWDTADDQNKGSQQLLLLLQTSRSYAWGMVATCLFTFMFFSSVGAMRHAFYETFLNSHRIMALMGIVGVYIHLSAAKLYEILPWVQLCLALWVAEIAWRIWRILYQNWSRKRGLTKVTVEYSSAEACRVTFELSRPWKWTPGCHVHAYIPALALWSSHPFSVAWAENRSRAAPMDIEMEKLAPAEAILANGISTRPFARESNYYRRSGIPQTTVNAAEAKAEATTTTTLPRSSDVTHLSLIVRARTGMTRKMLDKIMKQQNKSYTTWGLIEGPYGGHHSLSSYGTVILFAGGVGITHCVGYVHHLLQQYQEGTCATRKILLVWSVPNTDSLEWIREWMDVILRMEGRRDILRIQLFVSKPRHRLEVVSGTGSVQMFPGRCTPQTIMDKEIPERIGSVGVTVCGPGSFADSVRAACRSVMDEVSLDFIEEAFTY